MENKAFRIVFDKKRAIAGALLGIFFMVMIILQREVHLYENLSLGKAYLASIPLAFVFFVVGLVRIESSRPAVQLVLNLLWSLAVGVALMLWTHCAVDTISVWNLLPLRLAGNIAVFFILALLLYICTLRWRLSVSLASVLLFVWSVANGLVWQFRGKEIVFSDLAAAKTAMSVAGQYVPVITLRIAIGMAVWALIMFAQFCVPKFTCKAKLRARLVAAVAVVAMAVVAYAGLQDIHLLTYSTRGTTTNGNYLNFICSIEDSIIKEPEGYSEAAMTELSEAYTDTAAQTGPNIIVVMNESFADFGVMGSEITANQEILSYFHSLQDNTVRGYALTPAFGGATANAEFEFLTGHNMAFLPDGSYPYQQYIYDPVYALPWLMQSYGYETFATHPMLATGWSRNTIYPKIGFQESTFIDDYPQQNLVREHVSDQETYEYIMEKMYSKDPDSKLFLFGITMQNHGGYRYEGPNYTKTVELEGYPEEYPLAEQYLSVLQESDKALEYLIRSLEEYPEDTVLLFFGDHFPNVEGEFSIELRGKSPETLDELELIRTVPFIVWANYDIEEKTIERSSLSYLSLYLLEAAGIELPPYYQFLQQMSQVIPAINANGYYSVSEGRMLEHAEATGEEKLWLDKYRFAQHNNLFDGENRNELLFGQYLNP